MQKDLTAARLRELLHYDPDLGWFMWLRPCSCRTHPGAAAGHVDRSTGYVRIGVDGVVHHAHRLAVLYQTGEWPAEEVDHIKGLKDDNRWSELEQKSHAENSKNHTRPRRDNKLGVLGVFRAPSGRFVAQIRLNGKSTHIGRFDSAEAAHAAYLRARGVVENKA